MEVNVVPPPPPPPPPSCYDITGLTEDEAMFLRDLVGRFSCSYPDSRPAHFHTVLFDKLSTALRCAEDRPLKIKYRFKTAKDDYDPILQCTRRC